MGRSFISLTTLVSIMVMMIIIYNIGHCKAAAAAAVAADAHSVKSTTTTTTTSSNGNTKMNMTFTTSGSAAGSGCFGFENECLKIAEVETEDTSSSADELLMESHWGRMLFDYNNFVTKPTSKAGRPASGCEQHPKYRTCINARPNGVKLIKCDTFNRGC